MYHLALALVFVPASLIVLTRSPDQQSFAISEQSIDSEEEHHRQPDHDEDHGRRQPRFLPAWPCNFRDLASNLTEKLQRAAATAHWRRQFLACSFSRLFCRFSHRYLRRSYQLAGVEGLEPTALGFGDRCSTN